MIGSNLNPIFNFGILAIGRHHESQYIFSQGCGRISGPHF
jgi:hypothetical protein